MNKILEIVHGSRLYGLNTEKSDTDIFGIYLENKDEIIEDYFFNSNYKGREVDLSEVIKLSSGKNSPDALDKKLFSFKKYISRAINSSPNILELLYAPTKYVLFENEIGKELKSMRHDFLSKKTYFNFGAYAKSQAKKAKVKVEHFKSLEKIQEKLETLSENEYLFSFEKEKWFTDTIEVEQHHYKIKKTDYQIVKNQRVKRSIKEIEKIIGERSHRKKDIKTLGLDCKFTSHTLRLLYECEEILNDETISFPIKGRDEVFAVKQGLITLNEANKMIDSKWSDVERAFKTTKLPTVPNTDKIYKFVKEVYNDVLNK
jgi:predicted nucleotidyltransferase